MGHVIKGFWAKKPTKYAQRKGIITNIKIDRKLLMQYLEEVDQDLIYFGIAHTKKENQEYTILKSNYKGQKIKMKPQSKDDFIP